MTVQASFFDWGASGLDWNRAPYEAMSPNLTCLWKFLVSEWGGQPLGTSDFDRPIRGGEKPSTHSYGAATDWRYEPNWLPNTTPRPVPRDVVLGELIPWLIDNSFELRIDAIHDYVGDRIWRAGRTKDVADAHTKWWKDQNGAGDGMGDDWARWLHIETTREGFIYRTPILERPGITDPHPPPPPPDPTPQPPEEDDMLKPVLARSSANQYHLRRGVPGVGADNLRANEANRLKAKLDAGEGRPYLSPVDGLPITAFESNKPGGIPTLDETDLDLYVGYITFDSTAGGPKGDEG